MSGVARSGRPDGERGLVNSTQYAVLAPLLILVIIGIIQVGIWFHGRHAAVEAAELAADQARGSGADLAAARAVALRVTGVAGLDGVRVEIVRGPTRVDVRVSAKPPSILDLGLPRIDQRASAPVERVTR